MSTRKTLKDFFQSKGSSQTSISINPVDTNGNSTIEQGDDIGKDPVSGEELLDLDDNTTGMLGDYVSFLMSSYDHTNGTFNGTVANFYRPGPKNSKAPNSNRGNRAHSPLGSDGANKVYASENTTLGQTLGRYSKSGYISNLDNIVKKEGNPKNGEILNFTTEKVNSTGETFSNREIDEDVVRETVETFQGYNRYYPSKNPGDGLAYSEKGVTYGSDLDERYVSTYNNLGSSEEISDKLRVKNLLRMVPNILESYTGIKESDIVGKTIEEIEAALVLKDSKNVVSSKSLKTNLQKDVPDGIKESGYQISKNQILNDERSGEVFVGDYSDVSHENPEYIIYLGAIRLKSIIEIIVDIFESNSYKKGYISRVRGASLTPGLIDTTYKFGECIDEGLSILFGNGENDDMSFSSLVYGSKIKDSKYFWVAFFKSVIKESDRLLNTLEQSSSKDFLASFENSRLVQFANMIARVGDLSLFKTHGEGLKINTEVKRSNPLNVDDLRDSLPNVISKNKNNQGEISWSQGSTPSLFIMPIAVSNAATSLGTGITGANPLKSILSGKLQEQTYVTEAEGDFSRIPSRIVEKLENQLEASYVPFYFHDLRTNEIISFHAFLNSLSDSFNASYNPTSGYGRMDPVQIYRNTSRSISLGFTVAATSKKDFNEMWWKINKLITLLYPKWSKGTKVTDIETGSSFIQPFSQIIGASPMIRLRVGDVIKSNYSELALARKFGIGNSDTSISGRPGVTPVWGQKLRRETSDTIKIGLAFLASVAFVSPVAAVQSGVDFSQFLLKTIADVGGGAKFDKLAAVFDTYAGTIAQKYAINSLPLVNPISRNILNKFKNPIINDKYGPKEGDRVVIGATLPDFPYYSEKDGRYYHVKRSLVARIKERVKVENVFHFIAAIEDIDAPENLQGKEIILRFEDFIIS